MKSFKEKKKISKRVLKENIQLGTLTIPVVVLTVAFSYLPMFGTILAFKDYKVPKGILGSSIPPIIAFLSKSLYKYILIMSKWHYFVYIDKESCEGYLYINDNATKGASCIIKTWMLKIENTSEYNKTTDWQVSKNLIEQRGIYNEV